MKTSRNVITQVRHKWVFFFLKHFYWNKDNAIVHVRRELVFCKVTSSQRKTCNYRFQLTWITYKVNTVIWGGLVIGGRRYELHLTKFWKCIAGADFITECPCVFFLQFISTIENIIVYFIWHFSSSDTFYVFSVMYRAMDERQRHRWRMEDMCKDHRWRWD